MIFEIKKTEFLNNIKLSSVLSTENNLNPIFEITQITFTKEEILFKTLNSNSKLLTKQKNNNSSLEEEKTINIKTNIFLSIINKTPEELIKLEINDNFINIISGEFKCELNLFKIDLNYYFNIDKNQEHEICILKSNEILEINKVFSFLINNNENIYSNISLFLNKEEKNIKIIATDMVRVIKKILNNVNISKDSEILLNNKMISYLAQIFQEKDIDISIIEKDNEIIFKNKNRSLFINKKNEKFPNLEKVFKVSENTRVKINKNKLIEILERVSLIINKDKIPFVLLEIKSDSILFESFSYELGKISETTEQVEVFGIEQKIKINPFLLSELLKRNKSEEIEIVINSNQNPILITSDNDDYYQVILPMRE